MILIPSQSKQKKPERVFIKLNGEKQYLDDEQDRYDSNRNHFSLGEMREKTRAIKQAACRPQIEMTPIRLIQQARTHAPDTW